MIHLVLLKFTMVAILPLFAVSRTLPDNIGSQVATPNSSSPVSNAPLVINLDKRVITEWGPYRAWIWRSAAVLPAMAPLPDMRKFWVDMAFMGSHLALGGVIMNDFDYELGALQIKMNTADGSPMDWDFVTFLGFQMLQLNQKGWVDHFVGTFTNMQTRQVVVVTLQAVIGGVASMGPLLSGLDSAGSSFQHPGPSGGAPDS